ncbi:MAG TPA: tetraacyldisaccharide 4'-kinase [Quisquiliibacterium sp.]|nr:tetraacyldisaccharide 4'-kinase [Quisquiliibacterium sp.]
MTPGAHGARETLRAALERRLLALWFPPQPAPGSARPRDGAPISAVLMRALFAPLAALTARVARSRRARVRRLPPDARPAVIVIGNLVVGGTGKTPAAIAVARDLSRRGWRVGALAGGYRAQRRDARRVPSDGDAREHGDEAVLLAAATGLPVAAGRRRAEALALLEALRPAPELVISDDGLQHAGLPRTLEVAVFDARGAGNGRLLPAGPLREPLAHLASMDALLLNGDAEPPPAGGLPCFRFRVEPDGFRSLRDGRRLDREAFAALAAGRPLAALAGIAQPARFFDTLRGLGLSPSEHPLADHAKIDPGTLAAIAEPLIVMTTKDAVKCSAIADDRCWALEVSARIEPAFYDWIEERLRGQPIA